MCLVNPMCVAGQEMTRLGSTVSPSVSSFHAHFCAMPQPRCETPGAIIPTAPSAYVGWYLPEYSLQATILYKCYQTKCFLLIKQNHLRFPQQ